MTRQHKLPLPPAYWRLWWASSTSALGDGMSAAAIPLLAASLSRDPRLVAGVATAVTLPWLLFSLHSGALVDRLDKRVVMFSTDILRGAVMLFIALSVWGHWARLPLLYLSSLLLGFGDVLFGNAAQAMVPAVVTHPDQLERANGLQYSSETVGRQFAGPPIGSFLFAAVAGLPFALDGASFLASAVLIWSVRGTYRARSHAMDDTAPKTKLRHEIREGLSWLFRNRLLRTLALCLGVMNMCSNGAMAVFVLFAEDRLHVGKRGYGILLAAAAVGAVIAGLVGDRVSRRVGQGRTLILAAIFEGGQFVMMAFTHSPIVATLFIVLAGFWAICWNIVTVSLRQAIVPSHLFGRVNSAYRLFGLGMMPIGTLVGGFLAHAFGLRSPFIVLGVGIVALAVPIGIVATGHAIAEARESGAQA